MVIYGSVLDDSRIFNLLCVVDDLKNFYCIDWKGYNLVKFNL